MGSRIHKFNFVLSRQDFMQAIGVKTGKLEKKVKSPPPTALG